MQVSIYVASTRIQVIRDYLSWLILVRGANPSLSQDARLALESLRTRTVQALNARIPTANAIGTLDAREGLPSPVVDELLRVTNPDSPDNPWKDLHSRVRNALAIQWLADLGIRRGELLAVRISDIDFRGGTVVIARRPDNQDDSRSLLPTAKTRARKLPLSGQLLESTKAYILNYRANVGGARRHDFLWVATDTGAPLSIPSIVKMFSVLRERCSSLPKALTPHVLRHTWNDRYSEEMDRNKVSEEVEKKTRAYLMGWSETSDTAALYTRRHIREKAREASLALQARAISSKRSPR